MKTREQIYGQEAAGILRDVSMYRALTEMQLLKLYPHKESKIRNLLSYLQKQGRIVQRGEYYRIPADAEESIDHGLSKAVWVLTDFMEQVEYHSVSEYPAKIIFFADGEVYEIIYAEPGKEQLINQMLSTVKEVPPKYIVLIEQPEQIAEIHTPNTSGYCTVSSGGEVQYYLHAKQRRQAREVPTDPDDLSTEEAPGISDPTDLLCCIENAALEEVLNRISERDRYIFFSRALHGRSFHELALELDLGYQGVAAAYHRVCKKVKDATGRDVK